MRIPVIFLTAASVSLFVTLVTQCSIVEAAATGLLHGNGKTNPGALVNTKPNLIEALKDALKDRALIQSGPEDEPKPRKDLKKRRFVSKAESKLGKKDGGEPKGDLLRQELAKETQDNCLARLLCGVQPKPQKPAQFTPINDYAYLVKEFFEIFGGPDAEDFKEEDEDKANDKVEEDDDDDENEARHSAEAIERVNITGSIEEVVSTSTSATIDYVTTGATITDLPSNSSEGIHKVTLEELVGDITLSPDDVQSIRQARSLLKVGDLNKSSYIQQKISELRVAESDSKKLRIAGQIVNSIRQPRQCKQFSVAASEILSTCPLTTEVVRYFNSNLKNGSQIALVKQAQNATEGGLVLLNDQANRPYAYFLDNSPIVANSKISTDLKNPTVPDRFITDLEQQIYEHKVKPANTGAEAVSIATPVFPPAPSKKKSPSKSSGDDDEDGSNEEDEDDENGEDEEDEEENEDEEEDEEEEDQEDDGNDEEANGDEPDSLDDLINNPEYQVRNYKYNNIKKGVKDTQGRKWKVNKKPKKTKVKVQEQTSPKPGLPPGIIKVYGIPQPSFDNEFSHIAGQIGSGPVVIFDQDDYDDHLPHRGPPVPQPRPRPRQPVSTRQRNSYAPINAPKKPVSSSKTTNNKLVNHSKIVIKPKATVKVASSEEEDEEDEDEDEEEDERSSRNGLSSSRTSSASVEDEEQRGNGRPSTSHYMTSSYGVFPAPRAEEYYRNGIPPRPRPVIPAQTHHNQYSSASSPDLSRSESSNTQIRGRLNFRPNTPGSGLIRPAYYPIAAAQQAPPSRGSYYSY